MGVADPHVFLSPVKIVFSADVARKWGRRNIMNASIIRQNNMVGTVRHGRSEDIWPRSRGRGSAARRASSRRRPRSMCYADDEDAQDTLDTGRTKVSRNHRGAGAQCASQFATSRCFAVDQRHARGNPDAVSRNSTMRWTISMWSSHDHTIILHHVGLCPFRGCPLQKSHGNHDGERTQCCGGLRKTWYTIVKYGATDDELGQVGLHDHEM